MALMSLVAGKGPLRGVHAFTWTTTTAPASAWAAAAVRQDGSAARARALSSTRGSARAATKKPTYLSPSSISTWKQCPLQFKFRYIERRKEPKTVELARGIAAHDALAKLLAIPTEQRTVEMLQHLFREAWSTMRNKSDYKVLFDGDVEKERAWGLESFQVLDNYWKLEDPTVRHRGRPRPPFPVSTPC